MCGEVNPWPSGRQTVVLELLAQFDLRYLAGRSQRDFLDEDDVVRYPPLRDAAFEPGQQFLAGG